MMKISVQNNLQLNKLTKPPPKTGSVCGLEKPILRNPSIVMTLNKLGSAFPTRLSFMRILIRRMLKEKPKLKVSDCTLDRDGYGHVVISLPLGNRDYSLIGYTKKLNPNERTDRVIATKWDACFCLFDGIPSKQQIKKLEKQVTNQEEGRYSKNILTLSRANKSIRLFEHVLSQLSQGKQPKSEKLLESGYLMRTTAVYGNGKFGIADRQIIVNQPGLTAPFQVEMLTVFLIREFTFFLIEHCAKLLGGKKSVKLNKDIKRYLGIGNSTGLGMAPFLMNHPCLLHSWIMAKEIALSRVLSLKKLKKEQISHLFKLIKRARIHVLEWNVEDNCQMERIKKIRRDLECFKKILTNTPKSLQFPLQNMFLKTNQMASETQELIASILIELAPEEVDDLEFCLANPHRPELNPSMTLSELKEIITCDYNWVSEVSFKKGKSDALFWYTSQEKLEPRLGKRYEEPGAELEMPFNIPQYVKKLSSKLANHKKLEISVGEFLLYHPELRHIVRRVQNTRKYPYSEVRDNLVDETCRPIDLLRFKLAYFGASKFDPKSDRWTRITLFQGAPTALDISEATPNSEKDLDDWIFSTFNK